MNPNFIHMLAAAKALADGHAGLKAQELRTVIIRQLSEHGRGRLYFRVSHIHQASAPGQSPAVDSGRLRQSISVVKVGPGIYKVGTNVRYAAGLEFGTRRVAARPFMRPALAAVRGRP